MLKTVEFKRHFREFRFLSLYRYRFDCALNEIRASIGSMSRQKKQLVPTGIDPRPMPGAQSEKTNKIVESVRPIRITEPGIESAEGARPISGMTY